MPYRNPQPYLAVLLLLSACATAPTPRPTAASTPTAAPAPIAAPAKAAAPDSRPDSRKITLLCGDKTRTAVFDQLGVPSGERPIDIAVTDKYIWVLFEPSRLLRIVRQGEKVEVEMTVGHADEHWSAFAIDPKDDSVWVTSAQKLAFLHITPTRGRQVVPLKKVVGEGGFGQLLIAEDGLYARPTSADKLIWRIDRTGKVLDTAFPAEPLAASSLGGAEVHDINRPLGVRLLLDGSGHVLVWDKKAGKMLQTDGKGGWTERADIHWFDHEVGGGSTVKGIDVGSKDERWFLAGGLRDLFFWKGRPVFLGPNAMGGRGGRDPWAQVFYVPDPTGGSVGLGEYYEICPGHFLWKVATNATGYAAITDKALLFGDFANAPDLP